MTGIELQPLDAGKLIDKTFKMFFSSIKKNLHISFVFMGICFGILLILGVIIGLFVYFNYGIFSETADIERYIPYILASIPIFLIVFILFSIILVFFYGMIHDLYINVFLENDWSFRKSFGLVKKNFWPIFLNGFIYSLFYSLLNCCCLFFPLLIFLSASIPSILYENKKSDGIGRSFSLVSKSFWNVLGVKLLEMLISFVFIVAILIVSLAITGIIIAILFMAKIIVEPSDSNTIILIYAIIVIVYLPLSFIISSFECALNVLIFFNQKIKFENFGVEYMANTLINENPVEKT